MRILMLNWRCPTNPKSGGAEYVTRKHLEAWALAGHEVHWLAGGTPGAPRYERLDITKQTIAQLSINPTDTSLPYLHLHRYGSPITVYLLAPLLYWFKWRGDFDLVVDQIHGISFLTPVWAWRSRKIAFIHEVAQEIWDEMVRWPMNIVGRLLEQVMFKLYRGVPFWVDAPSTREDLGKLGISRDSITVIPCAIETRRLAHLPVKEPTLTLIFLARLVKMKGIEKALYLISLLRHKTPSLKLWIVGSGSPTYIQHLKDLVQTMGLGSNIEFKGRVDEQEKSRLLSRAHWLIHTSVREGFGLTVLEANAHGTPVWALRSPGLTDIVKPMVNGIFIDEESPSLPDADAYAQLCQSTLNYVDTYQWPRIVQISLRLIAHDHPQID